MSLDHGGAVKHYPAQIKSFRFRLDTVTDVGEGEAAWDPDTGTMIIGMPGGNVRLNVGQEGLKRCRNNSGIDIKNGNLVYVTGSQGNRPTIELCDISDVNTIQLIGMATEDIDNNANGYVALWGNVKGDESQPIDTSLFPEGTKIYMSNSGGFSDTIPTDITDAVVLVGIVTRQHATEGQVEVIAPRYFTIGATYDGLFRQVIRNASDHVDASSAYTVANDLGRRGSFVIGSSTNTIAPNNVIVYSDGYASMLYMVDGNKSHMWFTDPTDSHDRSAFNYLRMELEPDGTLKIGNVLGGNYSKIEPDGSLEYNGDATVWEDDNIQALLLPVGASAPDTIAWRGGNILCKAFDGSALTEELHWGREHLHASKEGADCYLHLHWAPTTANTGNVKWQAEIVVERKEVGQVYSNTLSVISSADGTAWLTKSAAFPAITGVTDGIKISDQMAIRLFRDPTDDDDTYPNDAAIAFTIGIHYEKDRSGSRQITTK